MSFYRGEGRRAEGDGPVEIPPSPLDQHRTPGGYLADEGLVDAVNVSLRLGQPLLLTGQPGTGKTLLAYSLAWELKMEPVLKFETKSSSAARDLFYSYDALGRFNAAQAGDTDASPLDYMTFNALGLAILHANEPGKVKDLLRDKVHEEPRRSVVLIDEIDKAPRDFPNDLLNEIEELYFRIPELENRIVETDAAMRPVLVLTSNSEKNLPEAFLRRCVFYHLPFPEKDRLERILHARLGESVVGDRDLLERVLEIFDRLRASDAGLVKKPSTGELLAWLRWLVGNGGASDLDGPQMIEPALATLVKSRDDQERAREVLEEWLRTRPE